MHAQFDSIFYDLRCMLPTEFAKKKESWNYNIVT